MFFLIRVWQCKFDLLAACWINFHCVLRTFATQTIITTAICVFFSEQIVQRIVVEIEYFNCDFILLDKQKVQVNCKK
jgi:hypothetical protein